MYDCVQPAVLESHICAADAEAVGWLAPPRKQPSHSIKDPKCIRNKMAWSRLCVSNKAQNFKTMHRSESSIAVSNPGSLSVDKKLQPANRKWVKAEQRLCQCWYLEIFDDVVHIFLNLTVFMEFIVLSSLKHLIDYERLWNILEEFQRVWNPFYVFQICTPRMKGLKQMLFTNPLFSKLLCLVVARPGQ